jgi:type I restriction enzyme, S subunit
MSEWQEKSLGELATIEIGGTPPREIAKYWARDEQDGHTWVSIADLGSRIVSHSKERITELGVRNSNVKRVPEGTLIMSFKLSIGRAGIAGTDLYTNEAIAAIVPTNHRIDAEFLYHVLPPIAKNAITDNAVKGVTLNKQKLRSLLLRFPRSLNEQKRIAEILSTIDQTIANTEALIQKYQQIKAGLMHDLFTRGITPDGKLRPPREQAPELYKDSAIGWIPKEWEAKKLGEVVQFQRGHDIVEANFEKGTYPVVSSSGIIGYHSKCTAKSPNVVVGRKGTIGKVHFLDVDFWAHDTSLYAINFHQNDPLFVYYLCSYLNLARFGTKSGSPSLNRNDIHPLEVICPSPDEQKIINSRLIATDEKIKIIREGLEKLRKQKSGLMHDLLTGKVPVTLSES